MRKGSFVKGMVALGVACVVMVSVVLPVNGTEGTDDVNYYIVSPFNINDSDDNAD